jgi:hypothetical protein
MKIGEVLFSWDTGCAMFVVGIATWILPDQVQGSFAKDVYGVGIAVLSTISPMFFAALAIITSLSDNEYIDFLEENGTYTALIEVFGFALSVMLTVLVGSIVFYCFTVFHLQNPHYTQSKFLTICFLGGFFYSLIAGILASVDAIKYLKYRTKYLNIKRKNR